MMFNETMSAVNLPRTRYTESFSKTDDCRRRRRIIRRLLWPGRLERTDSRGLRQFSASAPNCDAEWNARTTRAVASVCNSDASRRISAGPDVPIACQTTVTRPRPSLSIIPSQRRTNSLAHRRADVAAKSCWQRTVYVRTMTRHVINSRRRPLRRRLRVDFSPCKCWVNLLLVVDTIASRC